MIKAIWNLFLAIIARPSKSIDYSDCIENQLIKHYYPIPEDLSNYSKSEIRAYANNLTEFILQKSGILNKQVD
jgi:hypothetical protein